MIKTKSIYQEKEKGDGTRILITRFYPRGVKKTKFDLWIRGASPEKDLLKKYRSGKISWVQFSKKFKEQLYNLEESKNAMKQISETAKRKNVTLLCYEKEGENCHRIIVKSVLDKQT